MKDLRAALSNITINQPSVIDLTEFSGSVACLAFLYNLSAPIASTARTNSKDFKRYEIKDLFSGQAVMRSMSIPSCWYTLDSVKKMLNKSKKDDPTTRKKIGTVFILIKKSGVEKDLLPWLARESTAVVSEESRPNRDFTKGTSAKKNSKSFDKKGDHGRAENLLNYFEVHQDEYCLYSAKFNKSSMRGLEKIQESINRKKKGYFTKQNIFRAVLAAFAMGSGVALPITYAFSSYHAYLVISLVFLSLLFVNFYYSKPWHMARLFNSWDEDFSDEHITKLLGQTGTRLIIPFKKSASSYLIALLFCGLFTASILNIFVPMNQSILIAVVVCLSSVMVFMTVCPHVQALFNKLCSGQSTAVPAPRQQPLIRTAIPESLRRLSQRNTAVFASYRRHPSRGNTVHVDHSGQNIVVHTPYGS